MHLMKLSFAVFTLILGGLLLLGTSPVMAKDDVQTKFTSKKARQYVKERYIGTCAKQYMGKFDTTTLSQQEKDGFKVHADTVCSCMYDRAARLFTPDQMADIAKSCCTTVGDLITPEKDRAYFEKLQTKYLDFAYKTDVMKKCGFVLDGVDLRIPEPKRGYRIQ